jgi:multidrug efflux pump subunit AcrB
VSLARAAVENSAVTYFVAVVILLAGVASFFQLGQLEDPTFTIKQAVIITPYPGADPEEVELEVTDRLELALQQLPQLDYLESYSMAGLSVIKANLEPSYSSEDVPQIWDELRRKVRDTQPALPPGSLGSTVNDTIGDVFGHLVAMVGDGFSYAELASYAKELKKELSLVEGVSRVEFWGIQDERVYLNSTQTQLSLLGISEATIGRILSTQNVVVDGGHVDVQDRRLRISPTGEFDSIRDIESLTINPSLVDARQQGATGTSELIRIRDLGEVTRGYADPPGTLMRYNGVPAIALAISNVPGVNVVTMGERVDERLRELTGSLPIGIELNRVHWQSNVIDDSVSSFLISFAQAVGIVIVVLTIGMGWRLASIIGLALVATILASFLLMSILDIDLQRMSLGALIIALGMMVDNAIVVADGFKVRLEQGMDRKQAAIESASTPSMPLLGATVVAVMAFYPIYASPEDAGEYCATLFSVVAISLLVSWLISVTLTPVQCMDMLPDPDLSKVDRDPYGGRLFGAFRSTVEGAIRMRWLTIGVMVVLLVLSLYGFGFVKQLFFPDSSMAKFMIDVWEPEGTRIERTAEDLALIEARLLQDDRVESVATFVGAGPPRFYLPVQPELRNPAYGQLIVNVADYRDIDALAAEYSAWARGALPDALVPVRKFGVGPSNAWKFEARISGPANADPDILRGLADEVLAVLRGSPLAGLSQTNWRQRVVRIVPTYNEERARYAGVSRTDVARATKQAYDGRRVGTYREGDELIPIVLRFAENERRRVGGLETLQVQPSNSTTAVPLAQVTDGVELTWEDPVIVRRDRRRTITVQANPIQGVTLPSLSAQVDAKIEQIELPPGYRLEWGGEAESSSDAQQSLVPGVLPAVVVMAIIVVALFNAYRPPLVIALVLPFVVIGITAGLLVSGAAFGFVALLGAMSLAGMMIKNAIVLLDQVDINLAEGKAPYDALIEAAVSRLSPVVLAAATTVLGVIPLLQDPFWIGLAVTVMAGLTFGTVVTMVLVPVLYATLYGLRAPGRA